MTNTRRYRHKKTGYTAEDSDIQYVISDKDGDFAGKVSRNIIEDSNDWELIKCNSCKFTDRSLRCFVCGSVLSTEPKKDYEILSVINDINHISYSKSYTSLPNLNVGYYWMIHSVKRLSDGEVFTIGDKIHTRIGKYEGKYLVRFEVPSRPNDDMKVWYNDNSWDHLPSVVHAKQPLFKTEDGVDVYEGTKYWVNDGWYRALQKIAKEPFIKPNLSDRAFSTKEAAEEYILMNKPCLSLKDIFEGGTHNYTTTFVSRLKQLVKSRIS